MNNPMLETLFAYDRWANQHLLEECCLLSQEQFEKPLGIGLGNLERTAAHLVGAMFFFADRLNRVPPRPRFENDGTTRSPQQLLEIFQAAERVLHAAIGRIVESHPLTDTLNWTSDYNAEPDPKRQFPYEVVLAQMLDHSIHHRQQCIDMLGLLEVDRPTSWHPFEWYNSTRTPK